MRTKFALLLAATFNLMQRLPGVPVVPLMLHAAEPEKKEASFGEKLSAWLREKESMAADLSAAKARAEKAEKELADAKTAAQAAADGHAAELTASNAKVRDAQAKQQEAENSLAAANARVDACKAIFAAIGFKSDEVKDKDGNALAANSPEFLSAFQASFNAHVANGVSAKLAELGIKSDKLPNASSTDQEETREELTAKLASCTDPKERGRIAAKLNALRDADWAAAASGKN